MPQKECCTEDDQLTTLLNKLQKMGLAVDGPWLVFVFVATVLKYSCLLAMNIF